MPNAQAMNPRDFQINQLRRRFSPKEASTASGLSLTFSMIPSDPDFPFEMPRGLECILQVPLNYPAQPESQPSLEVKNKEMGREWQVNVEHGFARLATGGIQNTTLLGMMNALDKQLEKLLTERKDEEPSITIISNSAAKKSIKSESQTMQPPIEMPVWTKKPPDPYSSSQLRLASERRGAELRQLEARLGRTSVFSKSADGIAYTLPLTPRRHLDLPVPLQAVNSIKLLVPILYPLEQCRIELLGTGREAARLTELSFRRHVKDNEGTNLMGHVNYLAQNMHTMATEVEDIPVQDDKDAEDFGPVNANKSGIENKIVGTSSGDDDRSHIKIIPRPPEWVVVHGDDESADSGSSDSYDSSDADEDDEEEGGARLETLPESTSVSGPERGISLSFPFLELYSIEVLELVSLSITVKCERCKDTTDISNLRDQAQKSESCKKCAMPLSVGYRRELMHTNSHRAGYLDLEGCTVTDMLPSNFLPTCSECSTTHPSPGVVSVRGESTMAICRECHRKMSFKIPEIKFLLVSAAARTDRLPVRKRPKESLGIIAGQELPRQGRCSHYNKSYRWFRFSCCSKVFACDKCHDEASDHPNEHANRMICGYCSREQNYRPEDCGVCHSSLIKKAGSGFWEGGKGTRDKSRMSRKGTLNLRFALIALLCLILLRSSEV